MFMSSRGWVPFTPELNDKKNISYTVSCYYDLSVDIMGFVDLFLATLLLKCLTVNTTMLKLSNIGPSVESVCKWAGFMLVDTHTLPVIALTLVSIGSRNYF
jgi:hypothetical protein